MANVKIGDVVRVLALDRNNGRLAIVIAPPAGAVKIPEGYVWVEFDRHMSEGHQRVYYAMVDLVAPKSLNS